MTGGGGGGGEGGCYPVQQVFPIFLRNGKSFFSNYIFSRSLILGTSVNEKKVQIGPTVMALKLDERGCWGGWGLETTPMDFFFYLFF